MVATTSASVTEKRKRRRPEKSGTASATPTVDEDQQHPDQAVAGAFPQVGLTRKESPGGDQGGGQAQCQAPEALGETCEIVSAARRSCARSASEPAPEAVPSRTASETLASQAISVYRRVGPFPSSVRFAASSRMATTPNKENV